MDAKAIAIIAVIAVAPLAIVIIVAMIRGYRIDLHMDRNKKKPPDNEE